MLVGGLPGTGKSTLAGALSEGREATVLRFDEIRKKLTGLRPDQPTPAAFGEGIYEPGLTHGTYAAMLRRARVALGFGESVVLDASWTDRAWRDQARAVAAACAADLVELRCVAPAGVAADRMLARAVRGGDPSDATPVVAAAMAEREVPWPTATAVDTAAPVDAAVQAALHVFGAA